MDALLQELARAVVGVLGVLLVPLLIQQLRKLGLQVSAEQDAKLRAVAQSAIRGAEEQAASVAKASMGGTVIKGSEKLERAVSTVLERLPGITPEEATRIVHEELPRAGAGAAAAAVGFLTSVREAATGPTQ